MHLTQPLDKGIYGPLKVEWRRVCHVKTLLHCAVFLLFSKSRVKSTTITNIMTGFSTTGVLPIDSDFQIENWHVYSTKTTQRAAIANTYSLTSRETSSKKCIAFSDLEIQLFLERYEEGYDGGDER